jgi:hypothetical protein
VRGSASAIPRKKLVQSSIRSARDVTVRKRFTSSSSASDLHDFALPASAKDGRATAIAALDREMHAEIKWSVGPGKRKVVKKEKKFGRAPSAQHSRSSSLGGAAQRPLRAWLDGPTDASAGVDFGLSGFDVHMLEEKPAHGQCLSPTSTASTISSSASTASSFGATDPVTTCARAILLDCYRERQHVQSSGVRKRTLEGRTKMGKGGSEAPLWSYPTDYSKSPDGGSGFSCGSSSSDDELKEVSSFGYVNCRADFAAIGYAD